MKRLAPVLLSLCAFATMGASCIDTDTAVFVDATIDQPQLTVTEEALGTSLTGSFLLVLHLGARASGESSVSFASFSLVDENDDVIVESLPIVASDPSPVTVEAGGADTAVTFTIDTSPDLLDPSVRDQICAGQIAISGVVEDSLATAPTPVESGLFSPIGCD